MGLSSGLGIQGTLETLLMRLPSFEELLNATTNLLIVSSLDKTLVPLYNEAEAQRNLPCLANSERHLVQRSSHGLRAAANQGQAWQETS